MEHWPQVQADLMETYGVRDDQAHTYAGPYYINLVYQLLTTPNTRCYRRWTADD